MTLQQLNKFSWFKSIFDRHYEGIKRFVFFRCGDAALSEDIAQEAFVKLWDVRDRVREDTVLSLLYSISANILKNHYKHQKVVLSFQKSEVPAEHYGEEADHDLRRQQLQEQLEKVLSDMPEKCRIPFLMNRIEELTYPEIAERLGLSVKAIEKRMSEAISYLKSNFEYKI